jgi:hypothetical protein
MSRVSNLKGSVYTAANVLAGSQPSNAKAGDIWFDSTHNALMIYDGVNGVWRGRVLTSTSTSTTTTSTTTS